MKKRTLTVIATAAALSALMALSAMAGEWVKDGNGWWFKNSDGSYPAGGIFTIGGANYAFNEYGYMVENAWFKSPNTGKWVYATGSGKLASDQWIDGKYYVGTDGVMLSNAWTPDGYYVGTDGAWVPGATGQGTGNPEDPDDSLNAYDLVTTARNAKLDDDYNDYGQSVDYSGYGDSAGITNWYTWTSDGGSSSGSGTSNSSGSSSSGSSDSSDDLASYSGSSSAFDDKPIIQEWRPRTESSYEDVTVTEVLGN